MDLLPYQDIYANLMASALTTVAAHVGQATGPGQAGVMGDGWQELVQVPSIDERLGGERLRRLLLSPETRRLCFELAVAEWLPVEARDGIQDALRRRFLSNLVWLLESPEAELEEDAARIFGALRDDVVRASGARREPALGDDASTRDLDQLAAEAAAAVSQWDLLVGERGRPDHAACERFEAQMRRQTRGRLDRLEPPNYDGGRTIHFKDLYVQPRFEGTDGASISSAQLRARLGRAIVLGDPGGGKSSFAKALCTELSQGTEHTAFYVELRQYAAKKRELGMGIVDFIELLVRSSYQLEPPESIVEYLMISGRGVVVFDGLDELLDTHDRKEIRNDVQSFCDRFPWAPVLVTSRAIGYYEVPLDDRFLVVELQEFDDQQVKDYVTRWFKLSPGPEELRHTPRDVTFLKESQSVRDLRSNPLLLALMCAIYKRQNYLPSNRAAVYEQCADMLFERWDRKRQITVERPIETKLKSALQHLAQWIYEDQDRQAGVTHHALVEQLVEFIVDGPIDDEDDARVAAEEIIQFCHGRGWVLVPTGTASNGDELFGFVHRTFLEFYSAGWYATRASDPGELARWVLPYVAKGEWYMVGLLAFQLRAQTQHDAGDALLREVLQRSEGASERERDNLLGFAARTLDFFMPKAALTREVVERVVHNHLEVARDGRGSDDLGGTPRYLSWRGTMVRVLDASPDFHRHIVESMSGAIMRGLDDPSLATEALDFLFYAELIRSHAAVTAQFDARLQEVRDGVRADGAALLDAAVRADPLAAHLAVAARHLPPADALEFHGPAVCFVDGRHPAAPTSRAGSMAEGLLHQAMNGSWGTQERGVVREIARAVIASPPPWTVPGPVATPLWLKHFKQAAPEREESEGTEWRSAELLVLSLLLAGSLDCLSPADRRGAHALIERAGSDPFWDRFGGILASIDADPEPFIGQLDAKHRPTLRSALAGRVVAVN